MKRVLAVLLCLLCALLLLVACGDDSTDTDSSQGSGNNTDNQGHTHTYKTNADWSKDAQGHWYDPTCDCEDAPITKLNHTDANNDGACDVCAYTNHEHEYSEEWTADCTNHWNAADCGHTVAGINVAPHEDKDNDGKCDVCKYIIEDLHIHVFSQEWTSGDGYHWHAALCEHKTEVADKAACNVNAAGICTVCDAKIKDIDKTNILAVIEAAVANNYKIISGDVLFEQLVYSGSESNGSLTLSNSATDGVYFVLGNGNSYYFLKDYDAAGNLIGGEQQWYEVIDEDNIFAVKMDVNNYTLDRVMGDPAKLNGYNYIPGAVLSGYDDTSTLAQTIYNFYDMMTKGDNVSDAKTNYDAEKNIYTFSFTRFTVNELTSGGEVYDTVLYLFDVSVEFTVNDDMIINSANIQVKEYSRLDAGNFSDDLVYDKETGLVTKSDNASPTCYNYIVGQTSGKRTYTSPYPRASLLPVAFDFYYVTEHEFPSGTEWVIHAEELIGDTITIPAGTYAYFHLGNPYPSTSSFDFLETSDFTFEFVNNNPDMAGRAWYMDPGSVDAMLNGYSAYTQCLKIKLRDAGTYTVTIGFGGLNKVFTLVIPGEEIPNVEPDTENKLNVLITDNNTYDVDYKEYKATLGEGKYTFTIPAGLGAVIDGESYPRVDFNETADGGTFTVELEADEVITIYFGAATKNVVFAVDVAYEACDVEDDVVDPIIPGPGDPTTTDIKGTYTGSNITVVIDETNVTFTNQKGNQTVARYEIVDGAVVLHNDTYGTIWASYLLAVNLTNGAVTSVVYNGTTISVAPAGGDDSGDEPGDIQGSGTEEDPYIITAGDYTAEYAGNGALGFVYYSFKADKNGIITVTSKFDGTIWLNLGSESNEGEAQSLSAFVPVGSEIVIAVADWDEQPANIPFTVSFEEKASDSFEALVGTWYAKSEDIFTILYTLTINADGKGTFSYDMGYGANEYNVTYVFVSGNSVTVGYSSGSLACTFDGTTFACQTGVMQDAFTFQTTPVEDGGSEGGDDPDEPTTDPLKEAVLGYYNINGSEVIIYQDSYGSGDYVANIYGTGYDLYFTIDVTDNGDGSYTLALTHKPSEIESGTDKIDTILGQEWVVTPGQSGEDEPTGDPLKEAVLGTYTIDGYEAMVYNSYTDDGYLVNVYGTGFDLYFTFEVTDNNDGSYKLTLTYLPRPDFESGTDKVDEILALDFTVTPGGTGSTEGTSENPYIVTEPGDFEAAFPEGYDPIWFAYTVTENGYVTISTEYANPWIQYGTSVDFVTANRDEMDNILKSVSIYALAGQTVYIAVGDFDFVEANVPFKVSFEAFDTQSSAHLAGNWTGAETSMFGSANYQITIDSNGTGSGTADYGYYQEAFDITFILVNGNKVTLYTVTTGDWGGAQGTIELSYAEANNTLSNSTLTLTQGGAPVVTPANKDLVFGNNSVNAEDVAFDYTASADIDIKVSVGDAVNGEVTVTYSVNGGEETTLASGTETVIELKAGDKLTVSAKTTSGHMTIKAEEIAAAPNGTVNNPYIIESLPYDMVLTGKHDKYYQLTATEDATIVISYPAGCYVSGIPSNHVKDEAGRTYTFDMKAGDVIIINPWTNNTEGDFTYTVKVAEPVEEKPDQGGDAVSDVGANGSGRAMRVIINKTEGTMSIIRAALAGNSLDTATGATEAKYSYSFDGSNVTYAVISGQSCTCTFDATGAIVSVIWGSATYTNFVQE